MVRWLLVIILSIVGGASLYAQQPVTSYYDSNQRLPKETFHVSETNPEVLQGLYTAFFMNGSVKTQGQYTNNQATGFWQYFYESGRPKMRGILKDNRNFGQWEYFYENGTLQMSGEVYDSLRQGLWQFYYENSTLKSEGSFEQGQKVDTWQDYYESGALKAKATYQGDTIHYQEYYPSSQPKLTGMKLHGKNEGLWQHYSEDGTLQAEGRYQQGQRQGPWKFYYPSGTVSSVGDFLDGASVGKWTYYHLNGRVSAEGAERDGVKEGYWKLYHSDGDFKGETIFDNGKGIYREYYPDSTLKVKGTIIDGVNQGEWQYFYPDSTLEGKCAFQEGEGTYYGYYPDGSLKMKGTVAQGERTGVWELYKPDGTLAGYYKSIYEDDQPAFQALEEFAAADDTLAVPVAVENPGYLFRKKKSLRYFTPRINESKRFIIGVNPMGLLINRLGVGVEYYLQERLGYEAEVGMYRKPFFAARQDVTPNLAYQRGAFLNLKQKFYHPDTRSGMFYFGHQLGFDYFYHYANVAAVNSTTGEPLHTPQNTLLAKEQTLSYSLLLGTRLIKGGDLINPNPARGRQSRSITFDLFVGIGIGYQMIHSQYNETPTTESITDLPDASGVVFPFYLGATVGYVF